MVLLIVVSEEIWLHTSNKSSSKTYSWITFIVIQSVLRSPSCIFVCGFSSLNIKDILNPNALLKGAFCPVLFI